MSHFIQAAKQFPLSLPFSLVDMAKTYRAEKLEKDNGTVFEDDFTKDELCQYSRYIKLIGGYMPSGKVK